MPRRSLLLVRQRPQPLCRSELLESYERISRSWLDRVQSEVSLWSDLANKLGATKSASEAVEAYTRCVAQRMQMAAEDGQHLLKDGQEITQQIGRALSNGWTKGSA